MRNQICFDVPNALSYRPQNVLFRSNFFGPDRKLNSVPLIKVVFWQKTEIYYLNVHNSSFGLAKNVNQFLVWLKTFGSAQNVLGPVKGRDIRKYDMFNHVTLPRTLIGPSNLPPLLYILQGQPLGIDTK